MFALGDTDGEVAVNPRRNMINQNTAVGTTLIIVLVGSITLGLQSSVGDATIYAKALEEKRAAMHDGILANVAPGGRSWGELGATGLNIRIGTIYLAEELRRVTGLAVTKVYKLLDTVFLFTAMLALFFYLRRWVPDHLCVIGLLYVAAILPLTYFQHYFHPWDRIQLSIWILLLYLVRERRFWLLALGLAVSIFVKNDTILLPGLYFVVYISRDHWRRVSLESVALFLISFGIYFALSVTRPAPLDPPSFEVGHAIRQIQTNIDELVQLNLRHPILIAFTVPVFLALVGIRSRERFVWSSVLFAFALSVIWFTWSNYAEIRAQMVLLVLVLPAALLTLQDRIGNWGVVPT
jgi:hypothetical protein